MKTNIMEVLNIPEEGQDPSYLYSWEWDNPEVINKITKGWEPVLSETHPYLVKKFGLSEDSFIHCENRTMIRIPRDNMFQDLEFRLDSLISLFRAYVYWKICKNFDIKLETSVNYLKDGSAYSLCLTARGSEKYINESYSMIDLFIQDVDDFIENKVIENKVKELKNKS